MNLLHYFLFGSIFNVYFIIVIVTNLLGLAATIVQVPDCFVSCLLRGNSCEAETPRSAFCDMTSHHPCLGGARSSCTKTMEDECPGSTRRSDRPLLSGTLCLAFSLTCFIYSQSAFFPFIILFRFYLLSCSAALAQLLPYSLCPLPTKLHLSWSPSVLSASHHSNWNHRHSLDLTLDIRRPSRLILRKLVI